MTPRQKAKELIERFKHADEAYYHESFKDSDLGKICALVAVDELINEVYNISHQYTAVYNNETKFYNYTDSKELKFWKEVKHEIEKL